MARVALDGITKRYDGVVAVDDLTLEVHDEELLVLLGPSGCGKSTVLRVIAGLERPDAGTVHLGDRCVDEIDAKDRDIAMVFQTYALYPHLSARQNIEFPLRSRGLDREARAAAVGEVAAVLDLAGFLDRKPAQLSGGERQRVALARAIVRRPAAFLMDEPLSNLDATLRVQTRAELVELQRRLGATVLFVTHDQVEAMTMGHRIAVMDRGVLQQIGEPQDVYDRPANLFVARFIGTPPMNVVDATVATPSDGRALDLEVGGTHLRAPGAVATGLATGSAAVRLGVRPEHVRLVPPPVTVATTTGATEPAGALAATVVAVESLGHERHVVCRLGTDLVIVRQPADGPAPAPGEAVGLAVSPEDLHVFDPVSGRRLGS